VDKSIAALDTNCSWGVKKNSRGHIAVWKGYKLHLDVSDGGFPLTACVTSAPVHDSQSAIPMEKLTEQKVPFSHSARRYSFPQGFSETALALAAS
jgi:hypothetical protein